MPDDFDYARRECGERPDARSIAALRKHEEIYGSFVLAKRIGVVRETVARYLAGLPVYASTARKVAAYLREHAR